MASASGVGVGSPTASGSHAAADAGDGLHHPSCTAREGPGPLLISNGYSSGVSRVPCDTQAYPEQKECT